MTSAKPKLIAAPSGSVNQQPAALVPTIQSVFVRGALMLAAVLSVPGVSLADEGGVSFWVPGQFGSLAAVPQTPGWSFAAVNYYTSVSAGGNVAAAREVTIGRLNPTVSVNL